MGVGTSNMRTRDNGSLPSRSYPINTAVASPTNLGRESGFKHSERASTWSPFHAFRRAPSLCSVYYKIEKEGIPSANGINALLSTGTRTR